MLISCVAYQDGERLAEIELREIHSYIVRPGCFVWVALLEPEPAELDWKFGYGLALLSMAGIDFYLFHRLRKYGWL